MRTVFVWGCLLSIAGGCASPDAAAESRAALLLCPDGGMSEPRRCLFGEVFADVRSNSALTITSERWIRDVDGIDALTGERIVRAVQQSSHSDVTTPEEALSLVDQAEVRVIAFEEIASGRAFFAYEYGVGDNSYGAYFPSNSSEVLASIHDGDVLDCTVIAQ